MLAALLCNLQPGPPPPPAQPAKHFGGGPFWRKYGYDDEEDLSSVAQEARAALPGAKAEKAEAAIFRAVEAIRNDEPERVVLDAQRIYERVFLNLRGELRKEIKEIIKAQVEHERLQELWRAEVKRRIQEEDEEEVLCLMFL